MAALAVILATLSGVAFAADFTPLRIEQTIEPRFPNSLSFSTVIRGEARVVINVDAEGTLIDVLVASYSDKAFADEAVSSLKQWRYVAARAHGEPVGVRMELKFEFSSVGRVISLTPIETTDAMFRSLKEREMHHNVCLPQELDHPVQYLVAKAPQHPGNAIGQPPQPRSVIVDFYVDQSGHPRMPVVTNGPYTALAQAAVDALSQWRFVTPTRDGKPVAVRTRQEFIFLASS